MVVKSKWDNPNKCLVWHLEHRKFSEVSQHIIIVQRRNRPPFEMGSPPELNWQRYVNWGPNVEFTSTPGLPISSMPLQHIHTIQNKNVVSVVDVFSCKTFFLLFNQCILFWLLMCKAPVSWWEWERWSLPSRSQTSNWEKQIREPDSDANVCWI